MLQRIWLFWIYIPGDPVWVAGKTKFMSRFEAVTLSCETTEVQVLSDFVIALGSSLSRI